MSEVKRITKIIVEYEDGTQEEIKEWTVDGEKHTQLGKDEPERVYQTTQKHIDVKQADQYTQDLYRTVDEIKQNVGKLTDFKGEITEIHPTKEGTTQKGRKWKLQEITLKDQTGETIKAQFWNEDADRVAKCQVGEYLTLKNWLIQEWNGEAYLKSGSKSGSSILYAKPLQQDKL